MAAWNTWTLVVSNVMDQSQGAEGAALLPSFMRKEEMREESSFFRELSCVTENGVKECSVGRGWQSSATQGQRALHNEVPAQPEP